MSIRNSWVSHLELLGRVQTRKRTEPRHGGPPVRLTDEQVLEARTLHEKYGFLPAQLLRHYKLKVTDGTRAWMSGILQYRLRSSPSKPLDPNLPRK